MLAKLDEPFSARCTDSIQNMDRGTMDEGRRESRPLRVLIADDEHDIADSLRLEHLPFGRQQLAAPTLHE
jgi:hypothetical protein